MYVIIIAGSLPTLRPLAQKAYMMSKSRSTKHKGYQQYQRAADGNSLRLKTYNVKHGHQRSGILSRQSASDQDILAPGITKTTDINVDYDSRKSKSEKGQESWEHHGDESMGIAHAVSTAEGV